MSGGNSQEDTPHCPLSPAVPHPHSCSLAPRSFVPRTAGWASAVTPSLSSQHTYPQRPLGPGVQFAPHFPSLVCLGPCWGPERRKDFIVFCLWPLRETFNSLGDHQYRRICFKELHLPLSTRCNLEAKKSSLNKCKSLYVFWGEIGLRILSYSQRDLRPNIIWLPGGQTSIRWKSSRTRDVV